MDLMEMLSSSSSTSQKVEKASYKLMLGEHWLCSVTLDVNNKRNNALHTALASKQQELALDDMLQVLNAVVSKCTLEKSSPKVSEKLDLSSLL